MSGVIGILTGAGTTGTQCADVIFNPTSGSTPRVVSLSSATTGSHLFVTKVNNAFSQPAPVTPTHVGDVATGITVRYASNFAAVSTGSGFCTMAALAYRSDNLDSNVTEGEYGNEP